MAKKVFLMLMVLVCLLAAFAYAEDIAVGNIKTEDLRLNQGQNTSLLLNPGSPFSIRLYEKTFIDFEVDGKIYYIIFDKLGDPATVRYTIDNRSTYKQEKIKLGDQLKVDLPTQSRFFYLNYKILHEPGTGEVANAVFEIGIPLITRYNMPVATTPNNDTNDSTTVKIITPEDKKGDNWVKYLIGIIIVLVLIIIILGPRRKDKSDSSEKKKAIPKTYYKKPKKKAFDEEDVYVVKPSNEE